MTLTRRTLGKVLSLFLLTALAEAQTSPSFEELGETLASGSEITVTDVTGNESHGEIIGLSPTRIELASEGQTRIFARSQIREIRQQTRGPLANGTFLGMAIGAGIGAGLGVAAAVDDGGFIDLGGEAILVGIAIGAVLGTTTGVLVDVLRKENRVIYTASGAQVLLQPGVTGARVSFRF